MPLELSGHTARIERPTNGQWAELPWGADVRPQDALRYSAAFGSAWGVGWRHRADFVVTDSAGNVVSGLGQTFNENLAGNAWVDATAPAIPGSYTLTVGDIPTAAQRLFRSAHYVSRDFGVSATAPPPPTTPSSGSGFSWPGLSWPMIAIIMAGLLALGVLI